MSTDETSLSIANKINELHKEAEGIASAAKEQANKAVEIAIECGRLLLEQKKTVGHGNWIDWIKSNCDFSEDTAQNYMRLFRRVREISEVEEGGSSKTDSSRYLEKLKAKSIKQAYIATGILPEHPKDDSPKVLQLTPHVKHIDALVLWYRKQTEDNPASKWTQFQREVLINDLNPLMEIYNELVDLQEGKEK